jgi:N4-gp56 family major capsid protein
MAIGVTTDALMLKEVDAYYDKTLIQPLRSAWCFGKYGQKREVKENNIIRFSKYPILGTQPIALTEGVNPDAQQLTKSSVTATVSLYGGYVEITEECDVYRMDPVVSIAQERVSWQAVESIDQITRDVIFGGTNILYAGSVAGQVNVATKITDVDMRKLARAMMVNLTPFFKPMVTGSTAVGSTPIQNAWLMFITPQVLYDLESSVTAFVNITKYSAQGGTEENEVGSFGYFRMLVSTNTPALSGKGASGSTVYYNNGSNYDVHQCLAIAPDAFGVVNADGGIKTIRKDKSMIGGPLELYGTAGWKARYTAKILDDSRMYRYECCAAL